MKKPNAKKRRELTTTPPTPYRPPDYLGVPFSAKQRSRRPFASATLTQADVESMVMEGELCARALESKLVKPANVNAARLILAGACLHIANTLKNRNPDAQMFRDLWPWARAASPKAMRRLFEIFWADVRATPDLYAALMDEEKPKRKKPERKRAAKKKAARKGKGGAL